MLLPLLHPDPFQVIFQVMRLIFVTVSDHYFFPGTAAAINSVLRYHPEARVCVVNNNLHNAGLSPQQRDALKSAGVELVEARAFAKRGRKLAAWELKAYAASDLPDSEDVLIGIDSDCVLCGPVHDVVAEAAATGRFIGGKDCPVDYDETYVSYGIDAPARNEKYMSASLYACALNEENRRILRKWGHCCNRAEFGGRPDALYPGHGDQGVLNAILFLDRGGDGVRVLKNTLWSQHHCYWQHALELREGRIYNPYAKDWQRSLHCGGTRKFWTVAHLELLERFQTHVLNYSWFLSMLWFGRCEVKADYFQNGHAHLAESLERYRGQVEEFRQQLA